MTKLESLSRAALYAQVTRLEGEKAALAAALRAQGSELFNGEWHAFGCIEHASRGAECTDRCLDARAALSGEGQAEVTVAEVCAFEAGRDDPGAQGWLEVREQARLAIGHAFHLIEHNKAMCARCREAKHRLSAALAALEVK